MQNNDRSREMAAEDSAPIAKSSPPGRVLFVDHTARLGGAELALLDLVTGLNRSEFYPVVLLGEQGPLVGRLKERGVETHVLELSASVRDVRKENLQWGALLRFKEIIQMTSYISRLCRFMYSSRIDLVHTNSLKSDILGGLAARITKRTLVWQVHDRISREYLPLPAVKVFKLLSRLLPDFLIANSRSTLHTLVETGATPVANPSSGYSPELHTSVVYQGVKIPAIYKGKVPEIQAPVIGLVGRLSEWKGQHIFIESAAKVRAKFPLAKFRIIGSALFGENDYELKIRSLAASLGLGDRLEFTGFQDDVAESIDQLDILVHASTIGEPFGRVVLEGMAAGKPIVATNGGAIPEIVVDGQTGYLVAMNDAEAMAAAICKLLSDPEKARLMGESGKRRASDCFSLDKTIRSVEEIYRSLLNPAKHH